MLIEVNNILVEPGKRDTGTCINLIFQAKCPFVYSSKLDFSGSSMFLCSVDLALAFFWPRLNCRGSFMDHTQSFAQMKFRLMCAYLYFECGKKVVPKLNTGHPQHSSVHSWTSVHLFWDSYICCDRFEKNQLQHHFVISSDTFE